MKTAFLLRVALGLSMTFALSAEPQFGLGKKNNDDKDKRDKKEAARDAKNEDRYVKLKEYSLSKYQNDPDFRDEVDEKFDQILREHSDRAYQNNVERTSFIRTVHEDNFRVHLKLYDNLRVEDHINRIGQRLVPQDSDKLFAFKVTPDPIPSAETLATGTIYISTGLISMLDSEAQLAFVLAHEMAHVQLDHWRERAMMDAGQEQYGADQAKKVRNLSLLGSLAGAGIGGGLASGNRLGGVVAGAAIGAGAGALLGWAIDRPLIVNWDKVQEDQADDLAFKQLLAASYDVREVPKLYDSIERLASRDTRVRLGFLGERKRVAQRKEKATELIANAYKAEIALKLQKGDFIGDSPEHRNLMGELKRDNGISAYYYDMFGMARANLQEAVSIRDNDPAAHYFYGKVLEQVGRTPEDRKLAMAEFANAVKFDYRKQNYGANLHYGLELMQENQQQNKQAITVALDNYVTEYSRWLLESQQLRYFPPNLDPIYEYMRLYGDPGWRPKPPDLSTIPNYTQALGSFAGDLPSPVQRANATSQAGTAGSDTMINKVSKGVGAARNPVNTIKRAGQIAQQAP